MLTNVSIFLAFQVHFGIYLHESLCLTG